MKRSLTFLLLGLTFSVTPVYGAPLPAFPLVDGSRLNVLVFTLGFVILLIFFLRKARAGEALYLRRIAGLDAIEEAIGRATEMGKPIYFVNGLDPPSTISTLAAINILGLVAQKVAEYETPLRVPNVDPLTFAIEKEVVRNAYVSAGKGDAYDPDTVYFIAGSQFAYAAAVSGSMVREKPATNIILGYFYAESLIFAETGAATGAVQIAGTDAVTQLPFFVAACDYTLIGEELYAASAYLTREPLLLGALKAQDAGKLLAGATLLFSAAYTFVMSAFAPGSPLKDLVLNILKTG
ncbi:MAG: DUF6754 domain-containing protein [bacterium JZ-2024 1]